MVVFFFTIAFMFFNFTTDRLNIRPLVLSDKQMIFELLNTSSWIKFIGDRNIKSIEDSENYIKAILVNKNYHYHVIELMPEQIPIGIITEICLSSCGACGLGCLPNSVYDRLVQTMHPRIKTIPTICNL